MTDQEHDSIFLTVNALADMYARYFEANREQIAGAIEEGNRERAREAAVMMTDGPKITLFLEPAVALAMIDRHGCEKVTGERHGYCITHDHAHPLAHYGDDRPCDACIAWLALQGPVTIPADHIRTHQR
jgi:hypothetical protein